MFQDTKHDDNNNVNNKIFCIASQKKMYIIC